MLCRCPLCLRELTDGHQIARFCPAHPELTEQITVGDNAAAALACRAPRCRSYGLIGLQGLMLRHVGCPRGRNPFWDEAAGRVVVNDRIASPVTSEQEAVGHWQVDALRLAAEHSPSPDMWFPAALLLKEPNPGEPRPYVLVDFTGARRVGKTFLAMHALDAEGYSNGGGPTESFIYAMPASGPVSAQEFLVTLRLRERMALNQQYDQWIRMSVVRPRNLKAAFFADETRAAAPAHQRRPLWRRAMNELSGAFSQISQALLPDAPPTAQRALVIYDIAGEAAERYAHETIAEHDEHMDVLAVLISAEDLRKEQARELDSINLATHRLQQIAQAKQHTPGVRCALIVTKCDLWSGGPSSLNLESLTAFAATDGAHPRLRDVLRRTAPDGRGRAPIVDRVWFTWPESATGASPAINGLEPFVNWCFERGGV
jgi:hypothetical protein